MANSQVVATSRAATEPRGPHGVRLSDYGQVTALLAVLIIVLVNIPSWVSTSVLRPERLLAPLFAMLALTGTVWLVMVVVRNWAVIRGLTSAEYYLTYGVRESADWIERPARAFDNLMQVPTLFYLACASMLIVRITDHAQLAYAWLFVALRLLHAAIYIGWNHLPYRFASFTASCIVLGVVWTRFALQSWPLW